MRTNREGTLHAGWFADLLAAMRQYGNWDHHFRLRSCIIYGGLEPHKNEYPHPHPPENTPFLPYDS
jgi:hypothetical protein